MCIAGIQEILIVYDYGIFSVSGGIWQHTDLVIRNLKTCQNRTEGDKYIIKSPLKEKEKSFGILFTLNAK